MHDNPHANYDIKKVTKTGKAMPTFLFHMYFVSNIHFASNETHFLHILYPTKPIPL